MRRPRLDLGSGTCAVCKKRSEYGVYACDRCLDAPVTRLMLRHPIRFFWIGWAHAFNAAPGDRVSW